MTSSAPPTAEATGPATTDPPPVDVRTLARDTSVLKVLLDKVKDAYDTHRAALEAHMRARYVGEGATQLEAKLGTRKIGTASWRRYTKPIVHDPAAQLAWVASRYPEHIVRAVIKSFADVLMDRLEVQEQTTDADGTVNPAFVYDPVSGEVIAWAHPPADDAGFPVVRLARGGADIVMDAWANGDLADVMVALDDTMHHRGHRSIAA